MRRAVPVLLAVILTAVSLPAQGWTELSTPGVTPRALHFRSPTAGVLVGDDGVLFRTNDGGASWTPLLPGLADPSSSILPVSRLWDCFFADGSTGYTTGSTTGVYKTSDGGFSWTRLPTGQPSGTAYGIAFATIDRGLVVGSGGTILRTTNGGGTWTAPASGTTNTLYSVAYADDNTAVIVGSNGEILRSTNAGSTWAGVASGTLETLRKVSFFGTAVGIAVGDNGVLLQSTNGGLSWQSRPSGVTTDLYAIHMVNGSFGMAVGIGATQAIRTTDGGATWEPLTSFPGGIGSPWDIFLIDENRGVVATSSRVARTTDGGATWSGQALRLRLPLYGIGFAPRLGGGLRTRAVGGFGTAFVASVFGTQFSDFSRSTVLTWRSAHGVLTGAGELLIISVGDSGVYGRDFTTSGGGGTFSLLPSPVRRTLRGVHMLTGTRGVVVGDSGTVLLSTNGGISWVVQTSGTFADLAGVGSRDTNYVFAVGRGGVILGSPNQGGSWFSIASGTTSDLRGIDFATPQIGVAVGVGGRIVRTTNGGGNWQVVSSPTASDLNGVYFANATRGAAVGAGGVILGTNDAGLTWTPQASASTVTLNAVVFYNDTVGIAVGDGETILRTDDGVTWVPAEGILPERFELSQNYPNPFNPGTRIPFRLGRAGRVTLNVADILGRSVATLVEATLGAGDHTAVWNGTDAAGRPLPTGVYFYTLAVVPLEGGPPFTRTGKMVLAK